MARFYTDYPVKSDRLLEHAERPFGVEPRGSLLVAGMAANGASQPIDLTLRLSAMGSFTGNPGKITSA
jgi:hypothetical protein